MIESTIAEEAAAELQLWHDMRRDRLVAGLVGVLGVALGIWCLVTFGIIVGLVILAMVVPALVLGAMEGVARVDRKLFRSRHATTSKTS